MVSSLTLPAIRTAIQEECSNASSASDVTFRLADADGDLKLDNVSSASNVNLYGIIAIDKESGGKSILTTFSITYSTWDGRVLYLDRRLDNKDLAVTFQRILARIAIKLGCGRLVWRYQVDEAPPTCPNHIPESLDGWVTLKWPRKDMIKFLGGEQQAHEEEASSKSLAIDIASIVTKALTAHNESLDEKRKSAFRLRLAKSDDVGAIARLIQELADYEKESDAVHITIDNLLADGFSGEGDASVDLFFCILLEDANTNHVFGMALCYQGYNLGVGRFVYLEDLFVEEAYRGVGSSIMKALASCCLALGCYSCVWQALDWNTPALNFYKKIGAQVQEGERTSRYTGQQLAEFATA